MTFLLLVLLSLQCIHPSLSRPLSDGTQQPNATSTQEHVVILTSDCPHPDLVLDRLGMSIDNADVTHTFNNSAFRGFSARLSSHCVTQLNAMDDVSHVEETAKVSSMEMRDGWQPKKRQYQQRRQEDAKPQQLQKRDDPPPAAISRGSAPWNLQRISTTKQVQGDPKSPNFSYSFQDPSLGNGVDIYIVDTGIYGQNTQFGHRVYQAWTYDGNNFTDGKGHGTHVSGTAAGSSFGVASNSNIVAVKVLDSDGEGSTSDTIAGIDKVIQFHDYRKAQPGFIGSVMSMSWGLGDSSASVNAAVNAASAMGIHVSLAAGNAGTDACKFSPSQLGGINSTSIVSVGSLDEDDGISSFSNYGEYVDIFAPGENVLSAWTAGPASTNVLSGTSMATPHVSGMMAYLMVSDRDLAGNTVAMKQKVVSMAQKVGFSQAPLLNNGAQGVAG